MENEEPEAGYLIRTCQHCHQKLEFQSDGVGMDIECPVCRKRTQLYDDSRFAQHPVEPAVAESAKYDWSIWRRWDAWRAALTLAAIPVVLIGGCYVMFHDDDSAGGYVARQPSQSVGAIDWDHALRKSEYDLYGTKVSTDEEIHKEAMEMQKEQDEGIGPAGMMIRAMEDR